MCLCLAVDALTGAIPKVPARGSSNRPSSRWKSPTDFHVRVSAGKEGIVNQCGVLAVLRWAVGGGCTWSCCRNLFVLLFIIIFYFFNFFFWGECGGLAVNLFLFCLSVQYKNVLVLLTLALARGSPTCVAFTTVYTP